MITPKFEEGQKINLARCGLSKAQICSLELTLPLAKAAIEAKVSKKNDVRDLLRDAQKSYQAAMRATEKLLCPKTNTHHESGWRVFDVDDDGTLGNGGTLDVSYLSMEKACEVIKKAIGALPGQTRKRTSIQIFRRIDKALLDGHIEDTGLNGPYMRLKPSRRGKYHTLIEIYYDAIGYSAPPDSGIHSYMNWLERKKRSIN